MSVDSLGLILCHEVWGITHALRTAAVGFERDGYVVDVVDFYDGAFSDDYAAASALRDALTLDRIEASLRETIDRVRDRGAARVAVIGYSMGGAIALWAAGSLPIDLAVSYYGGGLARPYWPGMATGIELAGRLTSPWIGFYGGRDPITPPAELESLTDSASLSPIPGEVVVFEHADHGFALDPADPRHDPGATAAATRRVRDLLAGVRDAPAAHTGAGGARLLARPHRTAP